MVALVKSMRFGHTFDVPQFLRDAEPKGEKLYRFQEQRYAAPLDEFERPIGKGTLEVKLYEFDVVKCTPKGVWIIDFSGNRRFVLADARKRYACPTVEEARTSFVARKKRQALIHHARAKTAEEAIRIVNGESEFGLAA